MDPVWKYGSPELLERSLNLPLLAKTFGVPDGAFDVFNLASLSYGGYLASYWELDSPFCSLNSESYILKVASAEPPQS